MKLITKSILSIILFVSMLSPVFSQYQPENGIIVELAHEKSLSDLEQFLYSNKTTHIELVKRLSQLREIYLLQTSGDRSAIMKILHRNSLFQEIMPDSKTELRRKPNDEFYEKQWNLKKIGLESVWDYTTGGTTLEGDDIVVAVMDNGFYPNLEDMSQNIYQNPHEAIGDKNNDGCPGICNVDDDGDGLIDEDGMGRLPGDPNYMTNFNQDDDENGYIDDIYGLNTATNSDTHPIKSHGSAVASIIGADADNGLGVASINWDVKILQISDGYSPSAVIEGYSYMQMMRQMYNRSDGNMGAFIVSSNYSLGINNSFPEEYPLWCSLYDSLGKEGIISVVATTNNHENVDVVGDIPSLCPSDYMITVSATDVQDQLIETGYGVENVDIAAPGIRAYSIKPIHSPPYNFFDGTSAATPHVAGVIGLMYSIPCQTFLSKYKDNPSQVNQLAARIINSGLMVEGLENKVKSGKRLDAYRSMLELSRDCNSSTGSDLSISIYPNPVQNELKIEFTAEPNRNTYIKIFNILGQEMYSKKFILDIFNESETTLNIEDYASSIYFIVITQGDHQETFKFLKS